jgi:hypothetical protein
MMVSEGAIVSDFWNGGISRSVGVHDPFIAKLCDEVQRKRLGERDTERHDTRLLWVATL